ncbi:microtubule-associated protein tau isoform X2 [Chelonus insularis]|uniref:microtubule-associated protein tau isoform X2 n=1 Tax=Chelonus insularis TaxID=460826 RepID=UPI00158D1C96|nr:microtubule-associated protein tau isoform X2 [Chelonus insularis]
MDPPQTPRPDDSGGRVSMVKQNPQGFQVRPQGPPGSPRYPINNGSIGGQRLAGQPPPNLNRLDSRASLRAAPSSPNQFGPQQPFGPRPISTGAPGNFPRAPPVYPGNQLNQGPPRFPPQGTPGAARGPSYPPPPGQRLPFNQNSQGIRPRPPGPPYNADIRQPLARNILGNYGTGAPRNEPIGRSETPVAPPRMNSEKSPPVQQEKMKNDTEVEKNDDPALLKKKLASRNGNGDDDDDDDDDVVMDTEQQAKSPTPKIMSPEVQKTPSPTVLMAENVSSTPSPEPRNLDANVKNSPTPQMSESTTPIPKTPERPVSRIETSKTPEVEVKGDHAAETESSTNVSRPASVKSMKSPAPDDKTPELLAASSDIRSSTSSPSSNILGFDDGKPRSLSPKSPVPHSSSPATSPLVSSTPKSPGTPKSDTEKKKTTFADEIEDRDDAKDDNINEKPQSRSETPAKEKPGTRPVTPATEKLPSRPGTSILSRPATPAVSEKSRPATPAEKTQTRPGTPAASIISQKPDPPTLAVDPNSPIRRSTSGRSIKSDAGENGVNQANAQPTTNGVAVSPTKKVASKSREGDKSKPAASPVKSPSKSIKSLPRTPEAGPPSTEKKKVPMNKIQVGAAPSPNLKTVRSKIGSLENTSYKPGGGKVKIENRKLDFSNAQPKIAAKNEKYTPSGGDKKITQVKLQWNAKPKVGSLENATYKPGGGDKKIETVKLDFKDKAKPKVGSKDNAKHVPGGGTVKIETQKIDIKAESKVGSLDNVKYKPGGGDKKIFDDKTYLRQMSPNVQSVNGSGTQSPVPSISDGKNGLPTSDENLNQEY